jgi:hypothetical protein
VARRGHRGPSGSHEVPSRQRPISLVHAGGDEPPVNWRHSSAATLDETAKKARQSFLDRCPGDFIEEFTSGSQTMWPEKETVSLTQFLTKKGRRAITEARRLPCALRGGTICSQPSPVEPALLGERIQITTQHMKSRLLRRRRISFLLAFVSSGVRRGVRFGAGFHAIASRGSGEPPGQGRRGGARAGQ